MHLKANLHFHSAEDPLDVVPYTLFEGIDRAKKLGFDVLASTCHTQNICTEEHVAYAADKGVLLIPGIEANIYEEGTKRKNHVVILNCDTSVNRVHTFDDLRQYREDHPDIFVIAVHPYFYGNFSLGERLEKYIDLFDAIEHSWLFTKWLNKNIQAAITATIHKKPLLATSDTHFLTFMGTNYTTVDAQEKSVESLFSAIRDFRYENTAEPRSTFDVFGTFAIHELLNHLHRLARTLKPKQKTYPATGTPKLEPVYVRAEDSKKQ